MIYLTLFLTFFKIGLFTFGGGYAMLPMIQTEVEAHAWITNEELINFIAVAESTPGPFALNIATYIGRIVGGIPGALAATGGVILPSFIVILIVAHFYEKFCRSKAVSSVMDGIRPAVVGLIAASALSIGKTTFFPHGFVIDYTMLTAVGIFAVILILSCVFKKLHPIVIILISGALGIAAGFAAN